MTPASTSPASAPYVGPDACSATIPSSTRRSSTICSGRTRRQHLWTVGGDDELGIWERPAQVSQHPLLPSGVQMELHFIDEHDGFRRKRIIEMRVALDHPPRKVGREGERDAKSTAQLIQLYNLGRAVRFGDDESKRTQLDAWTRYPWNHPAYRSANRTQIRRSIVEITPLLLLPQLLVFFGIEPLEKFPEVGSGAQCAFQGGVAHELRLEAAASLRRVEDGAVGVVERGDGKSMGLGPLLIGSDKGSQELFQPLPREVWSGGQRRSTPASNPADSVRGPDIHLQRL